VAVAVGLAEVLEAELAVVERMELGERVDGRAVHGVAVQRLDAGQRRVLEHATLDELHEVEGRAEHARVLTE
jgi:hypothetical protein